jgi:tetratricopeptide (TPR) repeat protein
MLFQPGQWLIASLLLCSSLYLRIPTALTPRPRLSEDSTAATAQSDFRRIYEQGEQALSENRLADAEKAFRQVLAMNPQDAGAHANLGVIAMRRKQWAVALQELKQSERLAPDVAGVRLNIGLTYYSEGDYEAAAAAFESVIRDDSSSTQAHYLLGMCDFFRGRYADTIGQLEPLWNTQSRNLGYLYVLAVAADEAGRRQTEERAAGQLAEVGENTPMLHLLIGKADLQRQRNDEALNELKLAAQRDPKLPFVHFYLGVVYRRQNRLAEAKAEFLEDLKIDPQIAYTYDELGSVCAYLQQSSEAETNYRKALQINPRLASSFYGLAKLLIGRQAYKEALQALDKAQSLDPQSASVHYLKAKALEGLGRRDEARTELAAVSRMQKTVRDNLEREVSGAAIPNPDLEQH